MLVEMYFIVLGMFTEDVFLSTLFFLFIFFCAFKNSSSKEYLCIIGVTSIR